MATNTLKKYILYPGCVVSTYDGQRHYISASKLASLYGVDMRECVIWDIGLFPTRNKNLIVLFPRDDGVYSLDNAVRTAP